jgi:hypothetical protein
MKKQDWSESASAVGDRSRVQGALRRKLQVPLARDGVELTRSTVHRILLRHDLVHDPERHRQAPGRFQRAAPNELWQMDFKSPKGWNAAVGPLSVLDDCSRYLLVLQAVWTNHGARVREQLESVFITCGVPQAMLMDHGIPWWSERAPSGVTRLTVWLMKQGIQLIGAAFATPRPRARWSDFMVPWNGRCVCGRYRASSRKPGWMSFAGSTTTCVRMRPWACRLRRVSGTAANAVTIRILRAGSIRGEPKL